MSFAAFHAAAEFSRPRLRFLMLLPPPLLLAPPPLFRLLFIDSH